MNTVTLPQGYSEIKNINLQTDKKLMVIVNVISLGIFFIAGIIGHLIVPIQTVFLNGINIFSGLILLVALIIYLVLHEFVHGVAMRYFCKEGKRSFGFTGMYAFAASNAYYDKKSYIIIAMAPIVLWGIVLLALNILLPMECFWFFYMLQIFNLSGGAGDLYVTALMCRQPADTLTYDTGVAMTMYSASAAREV